jgi:hypothetical protein
MLQMPCYKSEGVVGFIAGRAEGKGVLALGNRVLVGGMSASLAFWHCCTEILSTTLCGGEDVPIHVISS